ncbi:MAG: 5-formyltetrahydrofolate cyclo-ligase, partial [Erysipelotrichaceae bacterium]|nr:5-formyltetrahydrofolate cyclo-ligase [Erysipelotrichaceae bacterium]
MMVKPMDKKKAREQLRNRIPEQEYRLSAGRRIEERLLSSPLFQNAHRIFCYLSTTSEVMTDEIITVCLKDKELYLPKCLAKGEMLAVRMTEETVLTENRYGIREPDRIEETASDFDLIIVPCLAAGRNGERLGHGGGYYDRFLANSTGKTVCLCFERNISEEIPLDEHDVLMDVIISEEGVYCR